MWQSATCLSWFGLCVQSSVPRCVSHVFSDGLCRGWALFPSMTGAPASHTPAAHLIISTSSNTQVVSPLAARMCYAFPARASIRDSLLSWSYLCSFLTFKLCVSSTATSTTCMNPTVDSQSLTHLCLHLSFRLHHRELLCLSPSSLHCPRPELPNKFLYNLFFSPSWCQLLSLTYKPPTHLVNLYSRHIGGSRQPE